MSRITISHRIDTELLDRFEELMNNMRPGITRSYAINEAMELWIEVHQRHAAEHMETRGGADQRRE